MENIQKLKQNKYDRTNPALNSAVTARTEEMTDSFELNLDKWVEFVSWARWNIDLFFDLITPETGGIRLDLDQRVYLRCISRFISVYGVFPRGYGKCQAGDTLLFTEYGIKELGSFFNYMDNGEETFVKTNIKLVNRDCMLERANAGVYSGFLRTRVITTKEGYEVENSLNHPLLVLKNDKHCWVKTEDIMLGDSLVICKKNDVWGTNNKNIGVITKSLKHRNDPDCFNIYQKGISKQVLEASKNNVALFIKDFLKYYGFVSNSIIEFRVADKKTSKRLQVLLLNFGFISTRREKYSRKHKIKFYSIKIHRNSVEKFYEEIDIPKGECRNLGTDKSDYFYSKVESIKYSKNHVYDLSMPITNSFISNGFVSHNTYLEVLAMYHTAIFFPDIDLCLTAQTKENASKLLKEKHYEITKHFPLLANEIVSAQFAKDSAEVRFMSGSKVDILANNQSTKGVRRKRLNVEESALLNNDLFEDVLEPVVNVPRRTIGHLGVISPQELNGQINFFTTSGKCIAPLYGNI